MLSHRFPTIVTYFIKLSLSAYIVVTLGGASEYRLDQALDSAILEDTNVKNVSSSLPIGTTTTPNSNENSDQNDLDNSTTSSPDDTNATDHHTTQRPKQSPNSTNDLNSNDLSTITPSSGDQSQGFGPTKPGSGHDQIFYCKIQFLRNRLHESTALIFIDIPSVLIIFGAIWGVASQYIPQHHLFPKFNSRIYFQLFLPSIMMDYSLSLGDRSFFLALIPILAHTILGTILNAVLLGSTIYGLGQSDMFDQRITIDQVTSKSMGSINKTIEFHDRHLNLAPTECMLLSTILSSLDLNSIQAVAHELNINRKLYYLISGESIINNAVVVALYDLVSGFLNDDRITVVRIYTACITFFIMFVGAIVIGLLFALLALFLTSQINVVETAQHKATIVNKVIIEAVIVLLLAYSSYIVSYIIGISAIITMITFGLLQDQYIKHNLSYRSQVACLQVSSGMRSLTDVLIYTLLGIELVDTGASIPITSGDRGPSLDLVEELYFWNYKFIATAAILTLVYRFIVVIALSSLCNWCSGTHMKITLHEQLVMALGGLKGSIAFALTARLNERGLAKNQVLFWRTILTIITLSIVIIGNLTRPLVAALGVTREPEPKAPIFSRIQCKMNDHLMRGLDSVMGYNKNLYARFIDFNELHIRPWLTKRGARTNWLVSEYNQLIISEVLDKHVIDHLHAMQNLNLLKKSLRRTTFSTMGRGSSVGQHPIGAELTIGSGDQDLLTVPASMDGHHRDQHQDKNQHQHQRVMSRRNQRKSDDVVSAINKQLERVVFDDIGLAVGTSKQLARANYTNRSNARNLTKSGPTSSNRLDQNGSSFVPKHKVAPAKPARRETHQIVMNRLQSIEESSQSTSSGGDLDEMTSRESESDAILEKSQHLQNLMALTSSLDGRSRLARVGLGASSLSSAGAPSSGDKRKRDLGGHLRQARLMSVTPRRQHRLINCRPGMDSLMSSQLDRQQVNMKPATTSQRPPNSHRAKAEVSSRSRKAHSRQMAPETVRVSIDSDDSSRGG